jgi:N-acetylmuramoyl-L-alanine amidase
MLRLLAFVLLLTVSLSALSDSAILSKADKLLWSKSQSNQFRAYNSYKKIYLKTMSSDDKHLAFRALQGIVASGVKLHIDVSLYAKKLNNYSLPAKIKKPIIKIKPKPKPKIKKKIKPKPIIKQTKQVKKNIIRIIKPKPKNKTLIVKPTHKLESIKWVRGSLVLSFDKKLKPKQVNFFTMYSKKTKTYKYVIDIHSSMITKSKNLKKTGIKRIKLGQVDLDTIRLVIENNKKVKIRYSKKLSNLKIRINPKATKTIRRSKIARLPPKRRDRNKIIVIDPGHGGKDPGAIGYRKYKEKIVVLKIALELKKLLRSRGYRVYMTRSGDKYIKLRDRTQLANRKKADLFVSIHANAVPKKSAAKAYGIECFFLSPSRSGRAKKVAAKENSADLSDMNFYGKSSYLNLLNHRNILASNRLAIDLQRGMLGSLNKRYKDVKDGGVREGPFWVLVGAQMPSVLIEVGFITNKKEASRLTTSRYRRRMAKGMADGIQRYFLNN